MKIAFTALLFIFVTFAFVKGNLDVSKGQLISKCPFDLIVWTNIPTIFFPRFLP